MVATTNLVRAFGYAIAGAATLRSAGVRAFAIPPSHLAAGSHNYESVRASRALHALESANGDAGPSRLVWLTGAGDLRTHDHGGFLDALAAAAAGDDGAARVVPVFVLDPAVHLRAQPASRLARLHAALAALDADLARLAASASFPGGATLCPLVVRSGNAVLQLLAVANEANAVACHVVTPDVEAGARAAQRRACRALGDAGIAVRTWDGALRPGAPWAGEGDAARLPSFFPAYCAVADGLPVPAPRPLPVAGGGGGPGVAGAASEGVPSLERLIEMAAAATPAAVLAARARSSAAAASIADAASATTEPFDALITRNWSTEKSARRGLDEYAATGKAAFADRHFIASDAKNLGEADRPPSLYAASTARLLAAQGRRPAAVLALREAPTRAFAAALASGALGARDVLDAARNRCTGAGVTPSRVPALKNANVAAGSNAAGLLPSDDPWWGRSSEGSLADVVEWREWYRLLAERSLAIQEEGEANNNAVSATSRTRSATSGGEKTMGGDPREAGRVNYWRWKGQYLVRYMTWPAGQDYDAQEEGDKVPAMLLVHGFAASGEQWERLVHSLRAQNVQASRGDGAEKDTTPPIFAVDLVGFGHSEKPSLSYTQYLWEAQVVDFCVEVMEAVPAVLVGNSIGGGLSAGAAASLGKDICKGLVLCNTAGVLTDPDVYEGYNIDTAAKKVPRPDISTFTEAAMEGNPNDAPYAPVPLLGNNALDLFGRAIVDLIYPQIDQRLSLIYGNRLANADEAVAYAIKQSAKGPGSANVIGAGQKLAQNRPLNEVLRGFPTLVVMGLEDQVSSPAAARARAALFEKLPTGRSSSEETVNVVVKRIEEGGHCPHDEVPDAVAKAVLKWFSSSNFKGRTVDEGAEKTAPIQEVALSE